ncbi:MAG: YqgE/AlgH family protein, partial [Rikenellaceae bacterium]|nr:YqgE/AlgH family protein [Rikenellaceae bacterium]
MTDPETAYRNVQPGNLLLAEPYGCDPWFGRSVVWIASHEESGTFGFMVNKPLNLSLGEMIEDFPQGPFIPYLGGPVHTHTLNYIHRLGASLIPDAYPVANGIYWGGDYDLIRQLIETGELFPDQIKFFLGSAGWEADQLHEELRSGAWGVIEGEDTEILGHTHNLWYEAVEHSPIY